MTCGRWRCPFCVVSCCVNWQCGVLQHQEEHVTKPPLYQFEENTQLFTGLHYSLVVILNTEVQGNHPWLCLTSWEHIDPKLPWAQKYRLDLDLDLDLDLCTFCFCLNLVKFVMCWPPAGRIHFTKCETPRGTWFTEVLNGRMEKVCTRR